MLPRDTSVLGLMLAQIGEFHRRINLAYHEWVRQYGTTDPMSSEALLPEHFVAFTRRCLRKTNPFVDFLTDKAYVVADERAEVPVRKLKEIYTQYRIEKNMQRDLKRWDEDLYKRPLARIGVRLVRKHNVDVDGQVFPEELVAVGLRAVRQ